MKEMKREHSTITSGKKQCISIICPCLTMLIIVLMSSCAPFAPEPRVSPEGNLPNSFSAYASGPAKPDRWWETFHDPELNTLIGQAMTGNFSLKRAWTRLRQARALAIQAGSGLYPDLRLETNASNGRQRSGENSGKRTIQEYSIGLLSSYELDLWGRIRSERDAAVLEASATREDMNTAAMTLAASVAERWANIISQRMQKQLLEKQLQANQTYHELVELRFRKSMVSALDVYQQKQVLEEVKSQVPLVESKEQLLMHELALLLGKPPAAHLRITRTSLPLPSNVPAAGLPADLLASRPDIRAAALRLRSADWKVAAARADQLPAIQLSGTAKYGPGKLEKIFDSWLTNLAGSLAAPLFDGKRRAAEVDKQMAAARETLWTYRETVYTAVKEVEDALVSEEKRRQHIRALESQMAAAKNALKQANQRYRKGLSDYLPVLTQLLAVQKLERNLIQQQTDLLSDRISLYRALGGKW